MRVLFLGAIAAATTLAAPVSVIEKFSARYASLPLRFERGKSGYAAHSNGYSVILGPSGAELRLRGESIHMRFEGSLPSIHAIGLDELPGKVNYFLGNDPRKWRTDIPTYAKVKYRNVYPGIDLIFYGSGRELEYDFLVAPGADPAAIHLAFEGASELRRDASGAIVLRAGGESIRMRKPSVYQQSGRRIDGEYALLDRRQVAFHLAAYDRAQPLVIDPVIDYSTYLGGQGGDGATAIAIDPAGAVYLAGYTSTSPPDFPVVNAAQATTHGWTAAFVAKLDPTGSTLLYSTYLGGQDTMGGANATGIAVSAFGEAFIAGTTDSQSFPTRSAVQSFRNGPSDAFVVKLGPTGSTISYSTYYGADGYDYTGAIAVDTAGSAYIAGVHRRSNFLDPTQGFVAKLSPTGAAKVYETGIGGLGWENLNGIAIDAQRNVYITGTTSSANFPVTAGVFQPKPGVLPAYRTTDGGRSWTGASNGLGVHAFALKVDSQGTLYAAGEGGVFKSGDGGESWREANAGISPVNRRMLGFAIDPRVPATLYASTGQGGLLDPPAATYKSSNGGASWSPISFGEDVFFQGAIWLAVDTDRAVYAVMPWGILRSSDGGATWNPVTPGGFASVTIDPKRSSTLYTCSFDSGVWKSDDGGANWATLENSPPHVVRVAVDSASTNIVYGHSWDGFVFKSLDGGATWTTVYDGGGAVNALVLDGVDSSIVYLSGTFGVLKSIDGGGNWVATGFTGNAGQLAADPARSGVIYMGAGGGNDAFVTKLDANGRTVYSSFLGGSGSEEGRAIAVDAQGAAYIAGVTESADFPVVNAAQKSFTGGSDSFIAKISPSGAELVYSTYWGGSGTDIAQAIAVDAAGSAYVAGSTLSRDFPVKSAVQESFSGGVVSKSVDGAADWTPASRGLSGSYVRALAVHKAAPSVVFAGGSSGVFISRDGGGTWSATSLARPEITQLAIDPESPAIIYAGGPNGLYRSSDSGATWLKLAGLSSSYVTAVAVDPATPSRVYAAGAGGISRSTDRGEHWTTINRTLQYPNALAIDPANPSSLYALAFNFGGYAVFKSLDAGANWSVVNDYIGDGGTAAPPSLLVDPHTSSTLYVVIDGNVWRSDDSARGFRQLLNYPLDCQINGLAIDPRNSSKLYAGGGYSSSCIIKSDDGGVTWTQTNSTPGGLGVYSLLADPAAADTIYTTLSPANDGFVLKLDPDGSPRYSTYIGGGGLELPFGIALDGAGSAWIAGNSTSRDFPTVNALQPHFGGGPTYGGGDAFILKIKE